MACAVKPDMVDARAASSLLLLLRDPTPLLGDVDPAGRLFGAAGAAPSPSCVGGVGARGRLRLSLSGFGKSDCCHWLPFQNCKLLVLVELTACSQLSHAAACAILSQVTWQIGAKDMYHTPDSVMPVMRLASKCTHHSAACTSAALISCPHVKRYIGCHDKFCMVLEDTVHPCEVAPRTCKTWLFQVQLGQLSNFAQST